MQAAFLADCSKNQFDSSSQDSAGLESLKNFLCNAPTLFTPGETSKKYQLSTGDIITCVLWEDQFFITGTDIVKILVFRFKDIGKEIPNHKKFEEGIFSDLRNLKPGVDARLEDARSEFLDFLFRLGCVRTQKKQKVFGWFNVPHESLLKDALERDMKRGGCCPTGYLPPVSSHHTLNAKNSMGLGKNYFSPSTSYRQQSAISKKNSTPSAFPYQSLLNTFGQQDSLFSVDGAFSGTIDPALIDGFNIDFGDASVLQPNQQSRPSPTRIIVGTEEVQVFHDDPALQSLFTTLMDNTTPLGNASVFESIC